MTAPASGGGPQEGTTGGQQGGQEPPVQQGQAGTPQNGGGASQAGEQTGEQGGQSFDLNTITDPALRAMVEVQMRDAAEARREAAKYRTTLRETEGRLTEFQRSQETAEQAAERESQERQARLETLERENRDLKAGTAIATALADAKPINPATVEALVRSRLQYGQDGTPTNLPDVLQALKTSDPYLFRRTDAGAGAGAAEGSSAPVGGLNDFIRGAGRSALAR